MIDVFFLLFFLLFAKNKIKLAPDAEPRPSGKQDRKQEQEREKNKRNTPPPNVEVRGVYLWGNHSPSMWPDVSRGEAKVNGRWVPIEGFLGGEVIAAAEGSGDKVDAAAAAAAGREWISTTLVPALRAR